MLEAEEGLVLPHGWNELKITNKDCSLLDGIPERGDMYFVHSYVLKQRKKEKRQPHQTMGQNLELS